MPLQEFFENLHSTSWKMSRMMPQQLYSTACEGFQDPSETGMTISMQNAA